ncbi:MAG: homoserine dehydrogenase [Anaerolineae bacterium]
MKIALIGLGSVGQGFLDLVMDKAADLHTRYGLQIQLVAVATGSNGTLVNPDGLDLNTLRAALTSGHKPALAAYAGEAVRDWDALRIARESNADVLIEASPSNLKTGQPALDLCYAALNSGKHLILANKGPLAVDYVGLKACAEAAGTLLRFEATVMAGTPTLHLGMQALAGATLTEVRGILNGTTNYILTQMEGGLAYAEALQQAQALGYAEADPAGDVDGWDAAGKLLILAAALFDRRLTFDDLDVSGITAITPADIESARANGERYKLIARLTRDGGEVRAVRLPLSDPLANVSGATNAITLRTDVLGEVTLIGAGAGRRETGFALLADLLDIHRLTRAEDAVVRG